MIPALEGLLDQFPFRIQGFHADMFTDRVSADNHVVSSRSMESFVSTPAQPPIDVDRYRTLSFDCHGTLIVRQCLPTSVETPAPA